MNVQEKFIELRDAYLAERSKKRREEIYSEMQELIELHREELAPVYAASVHELLEKTESASLKQQLKGVLEIVSGAYIARHYFGKTTAWFHHRVNGNIINGKPSAFNRAEVQKIKEALRDIARQLDEVADTL